MSKIKKLSSKRILHLIASKTIVRHNDKYIYGEDIAKVFCDGYSILQIQLLNMTRYKTFKS
jgi:hypothetical protein